MTAAQAAMSHAVDREKEILALKERNRELLALLTKTMAKLREDSGSDDPMEPFAYDASWEELAIEVDAALAKSPTP